jgi:hypothetical protein
MDNRKVCSLSTSGIIDEPNLKLKKIVDYFIYSDKSQSNFFKDYIESFKYIIYKENDNIDNYLVTVKNSLLNILKRYFSTVEINVTKDDNEESETVLRNIYLDITVIDSDGNIGKYVKIAEVKKEV